jgi:uncharacterized protein YyaL (SSP411 family)
VLVTTTTGERAAELAKIVPLLEGKRAIDGRVTAYVCERRVCKEPAVDPEVFATQIAKISDYAKAGKGWAAAE